MIKPQNQMWAQLSRLHKEFPAWISATLAGRSADRSSMEPCETPPQPPSGSAAKAQDDLLHAEPAQEQDAPPQDYEAIISALKDKLIIPICDDSPGTQSRQNLQDKGQFLARQERWSELSQLIRTADTTGSRTSSGLPEADLLAYGARSDVVNAVEHALRDSCDTSAATAQGTTCGDAGLAKPGSCTSGGRRSGENPILIEGVMALESLRRDHPKDTYLTAIVALAHIDIAWIWRATAADDRLSKKKQEAQMRRAMAHFDRAAALLAPHKEQSRDSAFLSAAQCAVFAGQTANTMDVADAYGALIDQAPDNPRPMRALGAQMLPRANGSYAALELEARRTAARTQEAWGAGGYTWVYFDAIAIDAQACARVDPRFFLDGLRDILAADPSQEMINLLTAYCAVTLPNDRGLNAAADRNRVEISEAACWLVRRHLREVHPLIWAHACQGFDNSLRIASLRRFAAHGQAQAMQCLAHEFRDELDSGQRVSFSPDGYDLLPELSQQAAG